MANAVFINSFNRTVKAEGAYGDDPTDKGNYVCSDMKWAKGKTGQRIFTCENGSKPILIGTKYGISAPVLAAYLKRVPTVQEMKNLDIPTVQRIYQANYWNPLGLSMLKDQSTADIIFDGAVNEGTPTLKIMMADSVKLAHSAPISSIVTEINKDTKAAFNFIKEARAKEYARMGGPDLKGWMNRLNKFTDYAKANPIKTTIATLLFFLLLAYVIYRFRKAK